MGFGQVTNGICRYLLFYVSSGAGLECHPEKDHGQESHDFRVSQTTMPGSTDPWEGQLVDTSTSTIS